MRFSHNCHSPVSAEPDIHSHGGGGGDQVQDRDGRVPGCILVDECSWAFVGDVGVGAHVWDQIFRALSVLVLSVCDALVVSIFDAESTTRKSRASGQKRGSDNGLLVRLCGSYSHLRLVGIEVRTRTVFWFAYVIHILTCV